jgi:hypothetical protein
MMTTRMMINQNQPFIVLCMPFCIFSISATTGCLSGIGLRVNRSPALSINSVLAVPGKLDHVKLDWTYIEGDVAFYISAIADLIPNCGVTFRFQVEPPMHECVASRKIIAWGARFAKGNQPQPWFNRLFMSCLPFLVQNAKFDCHITKSGSCITQQQSAIIMWLASDP